MKNGILYFLKMDLVSWTARIILVALILSAPKLPPQGKAIPIALTIGVIAAFFSLFHVRSNRYVRTLINNAEAEFIRDFRHHYELSESCEFYVVRSYAADGRLFLSHKLDGETIYPNLIFMTYYPLMDRTVFQIRVISLLKKAPAEDHFFTVPKNGELDIRVERLEAKIEQVSVKFPDVDGRAIPEFPMKLDFHLRELLAAVNSKNASIS